MWSKNVTILSKWLKPGKIFVKAGNLPGKRDNGKPIGVFVSFSKPWCLIYRFWRPEGCTWSEHFLHRTCAVNNNFLDAPRERANQAPARWSCRRRSWHVSMVKKVGISRTKIWQNGPKSGMSWLEHSSSHSRAIDSRRFYFVVSSICTNL